MSSVGNLEGIFHLLLLSDIVLIMLEFAIRQKIMRHFFFNLGFILPSPGASLRAQKSSLVDVGIVVRSRVDIRGRDRPVAGEGSAQSRPL